MLINLNIDEASLLADYMEEYTEDTSLTSKYAREAVIASIRLAGRLCAKSVSLDSKELLEVPLHKILEGKMIKTNVGIEIVVQPGLNPAGSTTLQTSDMNLILMNSKNEDQTTTKPATQDTPAKRRGRPPKVDK